MHTHEQRTEEKDDRADGRSRTPRGLAGPLSDVTSGSLSPDTVSMLQSAVGNRAVSRRLAPDEYVHGADSDHDPVTQVDLVKAALNSPSSPLDDATRRTNESYYGVDLSSARVHNNPIGRRSAKAVDALAYTVGDHIVLGAEGAKPKTLRHELSHVVDNLTGNAAAGVDNGAGMGISTPDQSHERRAEANSAGVAAGAEHAPFTAHRAVNRELDSADSHVHRMVGGEQGTQGTTTLHQVSLEDPIHPTGDDFLDYVYNNFYEVRTSVSDPWKKNFAVLTYMNNSTNQMEVLDSFNAGSYGPHSEGAILGHLNNQQTSYRPVAIFTDRIPCHECQGQISAAVRSRAHGYDVPIYYITGSDRSQSKIKKWWKG